MPGEPHRQGGWWAAVCGAPKNQTRLIPQRALVYKIKEDIPTGERLDGAEASVKEPSFLVSVIPHPLPLLMVSLLLCPQIRLGASIYTVLSETTQADQTLHPILLFCHLIYLVCLSLCTPIYHPQSL